MSSFADYVGDVQLPDKRIVHGHVLTSHEWDTNSTNIVSIILEWPDGNVLTDSEYNEDLGVVFLHEYVTDALLLTKPEWYENTVP